MNREAFKLARDTLRIAVLGYGWHRVRTESGYYKYDHLTDTYAKDKTVTTAQTCYEPGPGKFEGEHWSIVHFYGDMLNGGSDEPLYYSNGTVAADIVEVLDVEREAFGFNADTSFVVLWYSDTGFVSMQQLTASEYDELREAWERDHPCEEES